MSATFYVGDAIQVMAGLPAGSVDLVLTSPPFLALRSYLPADHPDKALEGGSQSTPGEYIDWLLDVVDACARVLAPHGSLVFELGDTFSGSGGAGGDYAADGLREGQPTFDGSALRAHGLAGGETPWPKKEAGPRRNAPADRAAGLIRENRGGTGWPQAKSLSLIPESFRWAMVYGHNPFTGRECATWRLRNVIRWVRPNPPVGALGDKFRPATSELMVFCKAKDRFFDLDAVREPVKHPDQAAPSRNDAAVRALGDRRRDGYQYHGSASAGAPPLDWWNIPPGGYPGAHYAVWPAELCVKPIKAMCPSRVCRVCGEPSRRIVASVYDGECTPRGNVIGGTGRGPTGAIRPYAGKSLGFSDCGHDDWRPGVVLDPFGGSGTTALVATGHGRDCILIDLDERNYDLALDRVGPFILTKGKAA